MPAKSDQIAIRAAWISLFVSLFVLGLKYSAYLQTKSVAILSDATESIVNVIAAFIALLVMKHVAEPADKEHPYGHGKLEYFSAAFEGGLIAFASIAIIYASSKALFATPELKQIDMGVGIISIASVLNVFLAIYLKKIGREHKSEALLASGTHVLTDVWTSVGILAALVLVHFTNWWWLDPLVAILVGMQLARTGYQIVRKSMGGLLDEVEPQALHELTQTLNKNRRPGFIDIHQLRIIRSGRFHHIDAHLVVPEFWDVSHTHEQAQVFEDQVIQSYPYDGEMAFHLDPCGRKYCEFCDLHQCQIRQGVFAGLKKFTLQSVTGAPAVSILQSEKILKADNERKK